MLEKIILYALYVQISYCWFFNSDKAHKDETEQVPVPTKTVPFEMKSADEKFFLQAMATKDLSPLDACHHRVILEIEKTCSDMSEEELSKLAVHLLNCQSHTEGRRVYTCSARMTIAQCTKEMDPTTWNAYQIVSNRARAICYQTRQQQFRMKTEYTVNSLVHSAQKQINTMEYMQDSQTKMIDSATQTLNQVKSDQSELISHHNHLKSQQAHIQSSLAVTIRDLYKEKALIAAGHQAFAEMTSKIKDGLDGARELLVNQEKERQENHQEILHDLAQIRGKAKQVWEKIDDNSEKVLQFQQDTRVHYQETLHNLEKVNYTVNYVVRLINDTRTSIETKLYWLLGLVGSSGNRLAFVTTIILHIVYFLLAAFSASFLNTPMFTRLLLMMLVPLNAWSEIKQGNSLGFLAMTMFIVLSTTANWIVGWACYLALSKSKPNSPRITHTASHSSNHSSMYTATELATHSPIPAAKLAIQDGKKGLSRDELQKLVDILQKIHDSGVLSPQFPPGDIPTPAESLPDQEVPVNTPISALGGVGGPAERSRFTFNEVLTSSSVKSDLVQDNLAKGDFGVAESPKVDLVRRHLLKTLADGESLDQYGQPPTPSSCRTSRCSTPVSANKRGNKSDILNCSANKPQCLATTKAGNTCKNSALDGSGFCFRHQVA